MPYGGGVHPIIHGRIEIVDPRVPPSQISAPAPSPAVEPFVELHEQPIRLPASSRAASSRTGVPWSSRAVLVGPRLGERDERAAAEPEFAAVTPLRR